MFVFKILLRVVISIVVVLLVSIGISIPFYLDDMAELKELHSDDVKLMESPYGNIEYIDVGEGVPVLISHGTMGGHDHGLLMAKKLVGDGYRFIIPSRFGYLNSEMPADATFGEQADCYSYMLDQLGIEKVFVQGMSAGGVPATEFAIRYPEKTAGLILVSSITYTPSEGVESQSLPIPAFVYDAILGSDYVFWSIMKIAPTSINSMFGATEELVSILDQEERIFVEDISRTFLPVSARSAGWKNDGKNIGNLKEMKLEKIDTPTVIISAKDDSIAPYSWSQYLNNNINGARLYSYESGGHVLLGHTSEVKEITGGFINNILKDPGFDGRD